MGTRKTASGASSRRCLTPRRQIPLRRKGAFYSQTVLRCGMSSTAVIFAVPVTAASEMSFLRIFRLFLKALRSERSLQTEKPQLRFIAGINLRKPELRSLRCPPPVRRTRHGHRSGFVKLGESFWKHKKSLQNCLQRLFLREINAAALRRDDRAIGLSGCEGNRRSILRGIAVGAVQI